jgi:hypothetical protein
VFLGGQLADDGFQVKWVAPTELYVDLGFRGRPRPQVSGDPDSGASGLRLRNAVRASGWRHRRRRLVARRRFGLRASPRDPSYDDLDSAGAAVRSSFTGRSRLTSTASSEWAPAAIRRKPTSSCRARVFPPQQDGALTTTTQSASLGANGQLPLAPVRLVLAGRVPVRPQWRAGYRYDQLNAGTGAQPRGYRRAERRCDFPSSGLQPQAPP